VGERELRDDAAGGEQVDERPRAERETKGAVLGGVRFESPSRPHSLGVLIDGLAEDVRVHVRAR
jgi:hypothetical protein